jgi:nucleoside 2-deoxyribosyltransferase
MKVYLCGPINGRTDAECMEWRTCAKELLGDIETLDPMRRDYRGREVEPGLAAEIVENDLDDIKQCGALLVMFDKPSVGTAMEVRFAAGELGIPVYVVNASGAGLSPWMIYHARAVFPDLLAACMAIADHADSFEL